jgi:hypothetical protein
VETLIYIYINIYIHPPVNEHRPWQIGVGRLVSTKAVIFRVYINLLEGIYLPFWWLITTIGT